MERNVVPACRWLMSGLSQNVTAPRHAVTHRDRDDNKQRHLIVKVLAMKTKSMYLTSTLILALLLASPLAADETNMRYAGQAGMATRIVAIRD